METSPFARTVLQYLSRFCVQGGPVLLLTAVFGTAACNSITPPPPKPYAEQLIMPNGSAWMSEEAPFAFQGSWYWFDDGLRSDVQTVEAVLDREEETADAGQSQTRVFWYDQSNPNNLNFSDKQNTVTEICVAGSVQEYIAVGFEVCSTQSDEPPYEFPFVLGNCIQPGTQDIVQRFKGILFDINLTYADFDKIEVEFKEWKTDDPMQGDQARCIVYGDNATRGGSIPECESSVLESDTTKLRIHAHAQTAKSVGGRSLNLSMLQAIHVIVFKNDFEESPKKNSDLRYCLSRVYAFGYDEAPNDVDTEDFEQVTTVDSDCPAPDSEKSADTEPPDVPFRFLGGGDDR